MDLALRTAAERRQGARLAEGTPYGVTAVRLRTGRWTTLIDVSAGGVGLVTDAGMAPGAAIDIVVVDGDTSRVSRGTVVHSRVCALHPTQGARFRIGLCLTHTGVPAGTHGQRG